MSARGTRADALTDALQAALATEHRAVFGYALLGPRCSADDRELAVTCTAAHEQARDATMTTLAAAGADPVGPDPDYPALYPVRDAAAARALAVRLEDGVAAGWRYAYAVAASVGGTRATRLRATAQRQLTAAAIRATRWRSRVDPARATTPFPGI
ncbi:protein of unknown function [Jatrophihabitans endophyticus]|uniref:DUF4439 domain-containing protein n=1 Tax=Jatrophihabitans endophyticus TaxID=1206085 RepID=A0A1M5MG83_9ACTN|nr:DUF4439 domain-containing protein [Jatrophihabitans endophyticus]SHG75723.1 protein of unknown function [Jatrophihabitans endophyticus]